MGPRALLNTPPPAPWPGTVRRQRPETRYNLRRRPTWCPIPPSGSPWPSPRSAPGRRATASAPPPRPLGPRWFAKGIIAGLLTTSSCGNDARHHGRLLLPCCHIRTARPRHGGHTGIPATGDLFVTFRGSTPHAHFDPRARRTTLLAWGVRFVSQRIRRRSRTGVQRQARSCVRRTDISPHPPTYPDGEASGLAR